MVVLSHDLGHLAEMAVSINPVLQEVVHTNQELREAVPVNPGL